MKSASIEEFMVPATFARLRPGDVIIFKIDSILPSVVRDKAREVLEATFPDHEVIVLERGQSLDIIRPTPWWQFWRRK